MPSVLTTGTRVGPYEIVCLLGAGGMGEVYRARDTRLHRDVALKVLPSAVVNDPQRLARFEREAQLLASLNHPNIAHVYGLEDAGPVPALVMELVEGTTLQDLLGADDAGHSPSVPPGALPIDDAWRLARQIASALDAAHEKNIVHRDLKPGNIQVTPERGVKVLDFGLAKALDTNSAEREAGLDDGPGSGVGEESPTLTSPVGTRENVILGTAAYMAPEQARGKAVDKRADIWAFGCVLYEMLTGRPPFAGDTAADCLASVLATEPDFDALPAATPPHLRHLLHRCLQKDPRRRLRDIGDALSEAFAHEHASSKVVSARGRSSAIWGWAAATLLGAALVGPMFWRRSPQAPMDGTQAAPVTVAYVANANADAVSVVNAEVASVASTIPVGASPHGVAVAPDGTAVYVTNSGSGDVSVIDTGRRAVVGAIAVGTNPYGVVFSPDGTRAYVSNGGSRTVSVINTATRAVTATIRGLGNVRGLAINPIRGCLYAVNEDPLATVSVIDTTSDKVTGTVNLGGSFPVGIAVTPDGTRAYVSVGQNGNPFVAVVDTATDAVSATIAVGNMPTLLAITPNGGRVYVPNFGSDTASVIDTSSNRVMATVAVGPGPYGVAFSPDGSRAYITNAGAAAVSVIDVATNAVLATTHVGSLPAGLALTTSPRLAHAPAADRVDAAGSPRIRTWLAQ
jgi:YVTN family beta-propeller protein